MKKFLALLLTLALALTLVACTAPNNDNDNDNNEVPTVSIPSTPAEETPTEDNTPSVDRDFDDKNDVIYVMTPNGAANLRTDTNFDESSKSGVSVPNNTALDRTEADANWSKVVYEGEEYYIANKLIITKDVLDGFEDVSKTVKVAAASINVRYAPARLTDEPIYTLVEGVEVEVVGFNADLGEEGWYKIKLADDADYEYGYVSAYHEYYVAEASTEAATEASTEAAE